MLIFFSWKVCSGTGWKWYLVTCSFKKNRLSFHIKIANNTYSIVFKNAKLWIFNILQTFWVVAVDIWASIHQVMTYLNFPFKIKTKNLFKKWPLCESTETVFQWKLGSGSKILKCHNSANNCSNIDRDPSKCLEKQTLLGILKFKKKVKIYNTEYYLKFWCEIIPIY